MNIKDLRESDICEKFIRPAIEARAWDMRQSFAARQSTQAHFAEALVDEVA